MTGKTDLPFYWLHEQSGILAEAVRAYLRDQAGLKPASPEQIRLVRVYLKQWIDAPCWDVNLADEYTGGVLVRLRSEVDGLSSADDVRRWLMLGLEIGMDPL